MAQRKKPSLTDILSRFRDAQKTASDESAVVIPDDAAVVPDMDPTVEPTATADDVAVAAQAVEDAQDAVVDAKETLQAVADEFINEHTAALKKEAQIFGELFAVSCMEHMNKTAAVMDAEQRAYDTVIATLEEQSLLQKQAAIYDDAYKMTIARIAGFDSPESFQKAAGLDEMSPEDMAALMAADEGDASEEDPLADMSEEEIAALAEQLAAGDATAEDAAEEAPVEDAPVEESPVAEALESAADAAESNAEAIQAIAEAVQLLTGGAGDDEAPEEAAPEGDGPEAAAIADSYVNEDGDVNLEDIQNQAYANVLAQLGG